MRILIVGDEALIALCLGLTLQQAGHEVMGPAGCLDASLRLAEQKVPELALIDIGLGDGGSGIDVALGCLHKPFATRSLLDTIEVVGVLRRGATPVSLPEGLQLFTPGFIAGAG